MQQLIERADFFKKYNVDRERFEGASLKWEELEEIHADYTKIMPALEDSAVYIFNRLMKIPDVHSVRYRIKEPEHVVEKIIRKRIADSERVISLDNYRQELTDLIGLRALHLFKAQWQPIHSEITDTWDLKEKPVANYREGDSEEYKKKFKELDCDTPQHQAGYRSVHYIVETKPTKEIQPAEIQVRTIFEEAWSEIDHTIRYPYDQDNPVFGQFLSILNRLAGSADEMGTFVQNLKDQLRDLKEQHSQEIANREEQISSLQKYIKESIPDEKKYEPIEAQLKDLKQTLVSTESIGDLILKSRPINYSILDLITRKDVKNYNSTKNDS